MRYRITVRINNKVVELEFVPPSEHQSNGTVYKELNENGQPVREHSFLNDPFVNPSGGLWTNGHHYRWGEMLNIPCNLPDCERCPKDLG